MAQENTLLPESLRPPERLGEAPVGRFDHALRGRIRKALGALRHGRLELAGTDGEVERFGDDAAPVTARIGVRDRRFWRMVASGGGLGAAEAYMHGLWDTDDLVGALAVLARNRQVLAALEPRSGPLVRTARALWHRRNRNTLAGSRRNIATHYDLSNEFFALWLDSGMNYSAGLFRSARESLHQAQVNKLERICRRLRLQAGHRVLDIGCGWGAFAIHAAREHGCQVTATTISERQFDEASRRIEAAGVADRVELLQSDYRELEGRYDRVVSIEMVEAVGDDYLDGYMERVAALMEPEGEALIQAITIEDYRYRRALREIDFIKHYIFPGSFIPSLSRLTAAMARTDMCVADVFDLGSSYARTLRTWLQRFEARHDEVRGLGFDPRFIRMWRYYLAYCAAGFAERAISDIQLHLARPQARPAPRSSAAALGR